MVTRQKTMDSKFEELKDYINEKLITQDAKLKEICSSLLEDVRTEIMTEVKNQNIKIQKLESDKAMLQNQVAELRKISQKNHEENEELEQYGRRLCLRIDGVATEKDETSDDVLEKVVEMCKEANIDIPDVVIDRAHRIGNVYEDHSRKVKCRSIIVRFTTFRHRTRFYRAKKKFKKGVKVKLDLTKKRHKLLIEANEYCEKSSTVKFCYADINCRLRVKWVDPNEDDTFFSSMDDILQMAI